MDNVLSRLSVAQLNKAVRIKERIEALEAELTSLLGGSASPATGGGEGGIRRRRKMSAAAKAKIAAAQRARWAKVRAAKK